MAAVGERFWAAVDKQVSGDGSPGTEKMTRPHISSVPASPRGVPEPASVRMPVAAREWSGVLDIINGARVHAEAQKDHLLEQAETFRGAIEDLRREAELIRLQVGMAEAEARAAKAEAERQVSEARAQAEERVRDIQAKADLQVAEARSATRSAEERAANAEGWLRRIEEAATSLAPSLETTSIRRAA